MKMLKCIVSLIIIVSFSFILASCKKDDDTIPETTRTYPIQGLWTGTYSVTGSPTTSYYSFAIKPDGTIIVDSKAGTQQHISLGTWTLSGTILTCNYTCIYGTAGSIGLVQTSTATLDNTGKLTGSWQNVNGVIASGTLTLTRIN